MFFNLIINVFLVSARVGSLSTPALKNKTFALTNMSLQRSARHRHRVSIRAETSNRSGATSPRRQDAATIGRLLAAMRDVARAGHHNWRLRRNVDNKKLRNIPV